MKKSEYHVFSFDRASIGCGEVKSMTSSTEVTKFDLLKPTMKHSVLNSSVDWGQAFRERCSA